MAMSLVSNLEGSLKSGSLKVVRGFWDSQPYCITILVVRIGMLINKTYLNRQNAQIHGAD